jgi:6-phosphogluconolactonase (cycloisomerase 2 family)
MRVKRHKGEWFILAIAVIAMGILAGAEPESSPRLVSVQQLPQNFDLCTWENSTGANPNLIASLQQENLFSSLQSESSATLMAALQERGQQPPRGQAAAPISPYNAFDLPITERQERETAEMRAAGARVPLRTIKDTAPTYSAVAVDTNSGEVILQDNNLWSYRVFDRLSPTPKGPTEVSTPKRIVRGDKTALQFNNGLYVDPVNGDIFSVESDTGDKWVRFPREADGNVSPKAILHTPHRVYNIAGDEVKQELFVTVEFPPEVVVYRKDASGEEQPLRRIAGNNTGLDAPHGLAVDEKNRLLFVNTWGHHSNFRVQGTGKYLPPAIRVYSIDANGDAKPLRSITGAKTQLNWPAAMKFNPDNGDLYVANDIGRSVLVFANASNANGDVAPARVIKGPSTLLRNPTGIALDRKNQEVWVSNLGNSTATVYPLMADGDVAPLRIIRSAEESKRGVNFGRTAAVTYDPIRQEILVPN